MKLKEFKELLKKKAKNLKEIKVGFKESQRVLHFNSYGMDGKIYPRHYWYNEVFTPEQLRRRKLAIEGFDKCLQSCYKATIDYRARHIAYSLFCGKTPEQIEPNYYEDKWKFPTIHDEKLKMFISLQDLIDRHLWELKKDNGSVAQM